MRFKAKLRKDAAIDITPLVDIVFLLLIFFVVTTTFRESPGMELDLPETRSDRAVRTEDVEVEIGIAEGKAEINFRGKNYSPDELRRILKATLDALPAEKRTVVIRADKDVRYQTVFEVMDAAKEAGAANITLPAELKAGEGSGEGGS